MIKVVGIDLSLKSAGMAVISEPGQVTAHTIGYALEKGASWKEKIIRLHRITGEIIGFAEKHNATCFVIEHSIFGNRFRVFDLIPILSVVQSHLYVRFKTVPILLTAQTARKFITGSVKCKCEKKKCKCGKQSIEKYFVDHGITLKNNDEYDALAMAHVVFECVNNLIPSDPYKQEVQEKIKTFMDKNR